MSSGTDRFDWMFKIFDQATGPAVVISKNLEAVTKSFDAAAKASGEFDKSLQPKNAGGFRNALFEMTSIVGNLYSGLMVIGGAALNLGMAMLHGAADTEVSMLRMRMALGKASGEFDALEESVQRASGRSIFDEGLIRNDLAALLNAGLTMQQAQDSLAAAADFEAIRPGSKDAAVDFFASMAAMGDFSTRSIMQLRQFGISTKDVTADIAKTLGVSATTVNDLLEKKKIDAGTGMQAVFNVLQAKSGKGLGGVSIAVGDTLWGQLEKLKRFPGDFFQDLNRSASFEPLKASIGRLLEFLKGEGGDRIKAIAEKGFSALSKGIDWVTDPANLAKLGGVIDTMKVIGETAWSVASNVVSLGSSIFNLLDTLGVFKVLGLAFDGVVYVADVASTAVSAFVAALGDEIDSIADWINQVYETAVGIGQALWEGIQEGIKGGIDAIKVGASELADGAVGAVKSALGINSPSKVFMELGAFTAEGFEQGFAKSQPPALDLGNLQLPQPSSVGGNRSIELTVNVNGSGEGGKAQAQLIAHEIREQLLVVFDDFNLEGGA